MSIVGDERARAEILNVAQEYNREMITDREMEVEAQVLGIIKEIAESKKFPVSIKETTQAFSDKYGTEYEAPVTAKWIGTVIRKKLRIKAHKSRGVFVIPFSEAPKLEALYEKYGLTETTGPDDAER